jgi:competence protein ComEC
MTAPCVAGDRWHWDGVDFEILHPLQRRAGGEKTRSNDLSCVLRARIRNTAILFAADIERKTERDLVHRAAEMLPARILLAPHHGSRTSSSAEFLAMVAPEYSLFATGYRNRFGHPKDDVLERYRGAGSRIYRTDLDGAITVNVGSGGDIEIRRYRAAVRRYWHAPLENPDLPDEEES